MNHEKLALWSLEIIVIFLLLFAVQIPLRKGKFPAVRRVVSVLKVLLIPCTAILFVSLNSPFSSRHGDLLAAAYIVLTGDTAAGIAEYVIRRLRQYWDKSAEKRSGCLIRAGALSAAFCLCIFLYGTANAGHVKENRHTWKAGGIRQAHTFAFASDLHVGSAQSMDTLKEFCRQVNAAAPEFVILGGDVTDELTPRGDMTTAYRILSGIKAPVFFIYGNHDRQPDADFVGGRTYSDKQLTAAIRSAGIRILSDEYVKAADDLILLGRADIDAGDGRKPWPKLNNPYNGTGALIVADHQPYDKEQLAVEKSALQLSGHTHAGQLWPLQFIYRILGLPVYGEFKEPGTLLYVSAGESGWMMPLRTEENCEWELITLTPE